MCINMHISCAFFPDNPTPTNTITYIYTRTKLWNSQDAAHFPTTVNVDEITRTPNISTWENTRKEKRAVHGYINSPHRYNDVEISLCGYLSRFNSFEIWKFADERITLELCVFNKLLTSTILLEILTFNKRKYCLI